MSPIISSGVSEWYTSTDSIHLLAFAGSSLFCLVWSAVASHLTRTWLSFEILMEGFVLGSAVRSRCHTYQLIQSLQRNLLVIYLLWIQLFSFCLSHQWLPGMAAGADVAVSVVLKDSMQVVVFILSAELSIFQFSRIHLNLLPHNFHACYYLQTRAGLVSTGQPACLPESSHYPSIACYLNHFGLGSRRHFCTGLNYQISIYPWTSKNCLLSCHFDFCILFGLNFSSFGQNTPLSISCYLLSSSAPVEHSRLCPLIGGWPHSLVSCRRRPFQVCSMGIHGNL